MSRAALWLFVSAIVFVGALKASAQSVTMEAFHSNVLQQERRLRIALPESYTKEPAKRYPLLLVLDGEYVFYSALGASAVSSIYELIPEVIIVAVDENYVVNGKRTVRWTDGSYNPESGNLNESGVKFKSFLEKELLPYVDRTYRTTSFRVIAGHSFTATFIHFFMQNENSPFRGYIAVSGYMPAPLQAFVTEAAKGTKTDMFYFTSTGRDDLDGHLDSLTEHDRVLSKETNPKFHYHFENYPDVNHRTVINRSMETAISYVFSFYGPISAGEAKRESFSSNPIRYLETRRELAEKLYGLKISLRVSDLARARDVLLDNKHWSELRKASELAMRIPGGRQLGQTMLACYFEGTNQANPAIYEYARILENMPAAGEERTDIESRIRSLKEKLSLQERTAFEAAASRRQIIADELNKMGISTLPVDASTLNHRGYQQLYGLAANAELASKLFQWNLELFPDDPHVSDLYDSLAEAYLQLGDSGRAIENYNRALELEPKYEGATTARLIVERLRANPNNLSIIQKERSTAAASGSSK